MGVPLGDLLFHTRLRGSTYWSPPPSDCLAIFPSVLTAVFVRTSGDEDMCEFACEPGRQLLSRVRHTDRQECRLRRGCRCPMCTLGLDLQEPREGCGFCQGAYVISTQALEEEGRASYEMSDAA